MLKKTNRVYVGKIPIGNGAPIPIQSMLSLDSKDIAGNIKQALELEEAGCDILRVAIPGMDGITLIKELKKSINMPLVADIHFDYKLAILAAEAGIDKIRINPGNIGDKSRVKAVADICKERKIPIRIGVNSGSVEKHILEKYKTATPEALVESALFHANLLEEFEFFDILISMKAPNVKTMMTAYEIAAEKTSYPLHLGVTHSGTFNMGRIKSAIGIGGLLARGIGDTFRVSLTAPPVEEIILAKDILNALNIGDSAFNIIACPTCGRTTTDVITLTQKVENAFKNKNYPITIAVMGCIVNGPGEAQEADLGVTGVGDRCMIFSKGKLIKEVAANDVIKELEIQAKNIVKLEE